MNIESWLYDMIISYLKELRLINCKNTRYVLLFFFRFFWIEKYQTMYVHSATLLFWYITNIPTIIPYVPVHFYTVCGYIIMDRTSWSNFNDYYLINNYYLRVVGSCSIKSLPLDEAAAAPITPPLPQRLMSPFRFSPLEYRLSPPANRVSSPP